MSSCFAAVLVHWSTLTRCCLCTRIVAICKRFVKEMVRIVAIRRAKGATVVPTWQTHDSSALRLEMLTILDRPRRTNTDTTATASPAAGAGAGVGAGAGATTAANEMVQPLVRARRFALVPVPGYSLCHISIQSEASAWLHGLAGSAGSPFQLFQSQLEEATVEA